MEYRERGMQVWLTGHVPPHMGHYFDNCCKLQRPCGLSANNQTCDTVILLCVTRIRLLGTFMVICQLHPPLPDYWLTIRNVDHFFFIDVHELESTSRLMSTANTRHNLSSTSSFLGPDLLHGPHLPASSRYNAFGRGANTDLGNELLKDFGEMPGPNNLALKDYTVINVHTSVIPTYFPGIRIYS
jgi:endopolyphosphatase